MQNHSLRLALPLIAGTFFAAAGPPLAGAEKRDDPELERRSFRVAEGFEVNLFASEPMIANPIQMTFDPQGRLWVVGSSAYPQIKPGEKPNDKLIVLEDADRDGRAERRQVFADDLYVPTGFELGDGGAYVANPPDLLHLQDSDGDGRADRRRVVLSGFGTEDNHHSISAWRWGPGGLLYFQEGTFLHSHVETPHGLVRLQDGGVFHFRPRSMELAVFADYPASNPWGHAIDRWGQSILLDNPRMFFLSPLTANARATEDYLPIFRANTKHCGGEFIYSRHLPEDWQGNLLTCSYKVHAVERYQVVDEGSGFSVKRLRPLIVSTDVNFRPVDVKVGPDGAIYIADWYNPIIGHMQYSFRDPRRDRSHGRIWRVTAKDRLLVKPTRLYDTSVEDLLDHLKSPEAWTRKQTRRVLYEREPNEVAAALATWVEELDPGDPDINHHQLEALWAHQTIDVVEPELLKTLLRSKEPRARAAAVRVLRHWRGRLDDPLDLLAPAVNDLHPRVRLEAITALSYIPSRRSVELAMMAQDHPMDRHQEYALQLTLEALKPDWLPAVEAGRYNFGGNARYLEFALQAVQSRRLVVPARRLLQTASLSPERMEKVLDLLAHVGGPAELKLVLDRVLQGGGQDARLRAKALSQLRRTAIERSVVPAGRLNRIRRLFNHEDEGLRGEAVRLAGTWKVESLRPTLAALASGEETSNRMRHAAIDALVSLGGRKSVGVLERLAAPPYPLRVRHMSVSGLARLDLPTAARRVGDVLSVAGNDADPAEVFAAFVERRGGAEALARALDSTKLSEDVAKIALRYLYSVGRQDEPLVRLLNQAAGLTREAGPLTQEQLAQLMTDVVNKGDPARGEAVFRRKELSCFNCHAIGGAGGQVGPELGDLGASATIDYLIDAVLSPSKTIKDQYGSLVVMTDRGQIFHGVKVRQIGQELILRDAMREEIRIPVDTIEEQRDGGSLMPDGLANLISQSDLVHLIRFLSELGKPGPYAVTNTAVVRRWQVLDPVPGELASLDPKDFPGLVANNDSLNWASAYSLSSGELPHSALITAEAKPVSFARCQLHVTTPGNVRLLMNSPRGLKLCIDTRLVPVRSDLVVDLSRGLRTLTFMIGLDKRDKEGLRLELAELPGSPARAQPLGGR